DFTAHPLLVDREGKLWVSVGFGDGVRVYRVDGTRVSDLPVSGFRAIFETPSGEIWAVGPGDVSRCSLSGGILGSIPFPAKTNVESAVMATDGTVYVRASTEREGTQIYSVAPSREVTAVVTLDGSYGLAASRPGEIWLFNPQKG